MKKKLTCNRAWGMTAKKSLLQSTVLLLFCFSAFAQVSIKGNISDEKGNALPGATVQVKGSKNTTQTDQKGNFTLSIPSASSVLMFSFVGYESKEINAGNQSVINLMLTPASGNAGEVIVVGYGTQKKSDLTGAISSVSAKDLAKSTPINASEALQGRAAGVMVTNNTGTPGSEGTIRIRGIGTINNNDPIYVVDGMFVTSINYLNPSDIASMEVLKDASASAIYGSRGANGVVLITTQKGSSAKPVITFNAYGSLNKVSNLTETVNRDQYLDYKTTAYVNGYYRLNPTAAPGIDPYTTADPYFNYTKNILKPLYDKGYSTNWADSLFKTAYIQNYDIGIRGKSQNVRYAASAGYFDQKGILDNSSYKRYTFRINTDYAISKRLVIGENLSITSSSILGAGGFGDGRPNSIVPLILGASPIAQIINPNADPTDLDYRYNKFAANPEGSENPGANIARINDRINLLKIVGNVFGELELIKGLKLRTSFAVDYNSIDSSAYSPKYYISNTEQNPTSTVSQLHDNFFGQVWENTLNYNTKIADHSISALIGYSEELYKGKFTNAARQGTANNDPSLQVLNAATGAIALTGNKTQTSLRSYFARVNYAFADKYLLTATLRRDGSSKFAEDYRWGTFPSASAGWRLSNEKFFKNLNASFISNLKLRAGWGQIGNQSMPGGNNNPYLSLVEGINQYRYIFGDALANGNYLTSLGTPAISWETSQQTNIGLDLGLLRNKLTFSADYFVKNTKDMLLQVALPSYAGFPAIPYTNAGDIQNKGIEVVVGYHGTAGDFTYGMSANASRFINKAVSLGAGNKPITPVDVYTQLSFNRTEAGRSIGEFYGWVTDGIFQNMQEVQNHKNGTGQPIQPLALPGDFRFKDLNGDGVINASDRTWIGNPLPKFIYGFNLNLEYKNFDVTALFQGSYGNKLFNVNKKYMRTLNGAGGANLEAYEAAWRSEGTSNTQPIMSTVDRNDNFRVSDWYVEDGSYFRLKNLQIGYRISESWLKKAGISSSRIWVGGTDLFTITKYTGNDPEAGLSASPLFAGKEFSSYPKMKRYSLGVNLTF